MIIDPSKISLKGLYLDLGSSVGGTRNVYNNGIMCAKFYVGFSYSAPSGDTATVQDIVNWLQKYGTLRTAASNHTDIGTPADFGWADYGNTDPNKGAYLYDNKVLVPVNAENHDQVPGNSVWHLEYYLQAQADELTPINVYLKVTYTDDTDQDKTFSTLNDNLLTIVPEKRTTPSTNDFVINDVEIITNEYAAPTATLRELNYNSSFDLSLYGIKDFYSIYPDTENQNDYHIPYDASPNESLLNYPKKSLYVIFANKGENTSNRTIIVYNKFRNIIINDFESLGRGWFTYNHINAESGEYDQLNCDNFTPFNTDISTLKGLPLANMFQQFFYVTGYNEDEGKAEVISYVNNADNTPSIYVHDTFGIKMKFNIHLNENNSNCTEWAIKSVTLE